MRAVVIGAGGGIGGAVAGLLEARGDAVLRLGRRSAPPLDLCDEASIAEAAAAASAHGGGELGLVFDATGLLHDAAMTPEKSLRQLDPAQLARSFAVNATGPALLMKHFLPLLPRGARSVFATLSARVGSIEDNTLGGWYGYRAAKAALNQFVRTAAIELARTHPQAVCVALHPGTVRTGLSAPFAKAGLAVQAPEVAAARLVAVAEALVPARSGGFFDYRGTPIPF